MIVKPGRTGMEESTLMQWKSKFLEMKGKLKAERMNCLKELLDFEGKR
jgi:hypothetical protein